MRRSTKRSTMLSPNAAILMRSSSAWWPAVPATTAARLVGSGSVLDDAVVAPQVERVVPHPLEVLAEPVGDDVEDDRRHEASELLADPVEGEVAGVKRGDVVAVTGGEALDPLHQRSGGVLAAEQQHAGGALDELQGAVEELGGGHAGGPQPLHLLEHAHRVEVGQAPQVPGTDEEVVVGVLVRVRE